MLFQNVISTKSFVPWLRKDKENRRLLFLSAVTILLQFLIFKFFYPYPNFMPPDSYSYLEAAQENDMISMWAIGYSWFLRFLPFVTRYSISLVWFQYLLLELCLLYFLFSVRYLLAPGKWCFRILLACSVLNPLFPHISNFVSSDALFTTLSLVWFTQLFWMLYKPHLRLLLSHAVVLLLAFTVRYNALYYPFISIIVIILSNQIQRRVKGIAIGVIALLLFIFIGATQYAYYKKTGTVQFSAFGGWQLAANALYGYAYATPDSSSTFPYRFQALHTIVNRHVKTLSQKPLDLRPDRDVGIYYLWDFSSPLRVYMAEKWKKDSITPFFQKWAAMAPLYAAYGRTLIQRHPTSFMRHYMWPNLIKYYAPPPGFLSYYNLERSKVDSVAVRWFGWKHNTISNYFKDTRIEVTIFFSIVLPIINLVFVLGFGAFATLGGFKSRSAFGKRIVAWMLVVWACNMIFSVLSAPIELRYQLFPMVITTVFAGLFVAFLLRKTVYLATSQEAYAEKAEGLTITKIQLPDF